MNYSRTETREENNRVITLDAHIVAVQDKDGTIVGYVATCSTIKNDHMGFNTSSQSFVFDANNYGSAEEWCESHFNTKVGE